MFSFKIDNQSFYNKLLETNLLTEKRWWVKEEYNTKNIIGTIYKINEEFSYIELNISAVLILKNNEYYMFVEEYELMNPFVFKNILILPGHDSVTCVDFITKEVITSQIR